MKVEAFFHGILSEWVGVPRAEMNLPEGGDFFGLMAEIRRTYGHNMPAQLWDEDKKAFHQAVWALRGKEKLAVPTTKLNEGEEIRFFLTLTGG